MSDYKATTKDHIVWNIEGKLDNVLLRTNQKWLAERVVFLLNKYGSQQPCSCICCGNFGRIEYDDSVEDYVCKECGAKQSMTYKKVRCFNHWWWLVKYDPDPGGKSRLVRVNWANDIRKYGEVTIVMEALSSEINFP